MKRYKFYLPVVLSFLLVMGCMVPSPVYASEPSRDAQQIIKEAPAANSGMRLMADSGLDIDSGKTAEQLAQRIVGNAVEISNVTYAGEQVANGFFSGGSEIIGFEEGIILSTGFSGNVVGPNEYDDISGIFKTAGDADLNGLISEGTTNDASVLEFDFVPENDVISFSYVFASDEYNEYVNLEYNDVFGFFINGENVALVPDTDDPVSVNTINGGNPYGTGAKNSNFYRNNDMDDLGEADISIDTEMDGLTTVLKAKAEVTPGETNHIKLAIADVSDCVWDSVVFIEAESFVDDDQYGEFSFQQNAFSVYEDGINAEITVVRRNGTDGEVSVAYAMNEGTATDGSDYTSTSGILTFGDGESVKTFTVPIIDDADPEGDESVQLVLSNPTGGAAMGELINASLTIKDNENTCIVKGCKTLQADGGFTASSEIGGTIVYHIESPEQLAHICEHMSLDYIQTKDIDLGIGEFSEGWIPIGGFDGLSDFNGSYDGNGFVIENMVLDYTASYSDISAGLFAKASGKSHLQNINLSIDDIYLEREVPRGEAPGVVMFGGITGAHYSNYTIENCKVTMGAVEAINDEGDILIGGISGTNSGSISGCSASFESDIDLGAGYGDLYFGGIAAVNEYNGILEQCNAFLPAHVVIYGNQDFEFGGIAGYNYGRISNCHAEGDCIVDVNLYGYVEDRSGDADIGGVCGITDGVIEHSGQKGKLEVNANSEEPEPTLMKSAAEDLSSTSNITVKVESKMLEEENETNDINVGGIAGSVGSNYYYVFADGEDYHANIFNSDHTGDINVNSDTGYVDFDQLNVGGIAGIAYSNGGNMLLLENCQNDGSVRSGNQTGSAYSGGIVGYIYQDIPVLALEETEYSTGVKILNCANHQDDSEVAAIGTNEMAIAGGVAGASRFVPYAQPVIENCYNRSVVKSQLSFISYEKVDLQESGKGYACEGAASGGIIGASGGADILTSYSSADLVTSTAIFPTPSFAPSVMPVETQSGYAGGIAGLIWDTAFHKDYYKANDSVINGIGGAVKEIQQDEISTAEWYGDYEIIQPYSDPDVISASASDLKSKSFFDGAWKWYASGGTDPQYYHNTEPWRMIAADTYPVLRGKPYTPSSNGGGGGGGSSVETPPPVAGLPDGTLIDRMPGYLAFSKPLKINEVKSEITLSYDTDLQKNKSANTPRIYYWNADKKNWVAMATYPVSNGKVRAVNDGKYKGWFVVFGVVQPEFSDIEKSWAEQTINRMNGLGMVEGYPSLDGSLLRTVLPDREVSHAEFTMLISRLLNIDIDDPRLPLISKEESGKILKERFTDADQIPDWVLQAAGTLEKENILPDNGAEFNANTPITRIEAAVMISKAVNLLKQMQKADLSKFTDAGEIPDWAKGELVEGAMLGYPDNTFRPSGHLTRAESLTMLNRLFVEGLGW